ncbi:hypothetical protein LEMLEM_LOCUS17283 [Lemmus lemmus]
MAALITSPHLHSKRLPEELPSTTADGRLVLSTAPPPRVTRLPWHRRRDQDAEESIGPGRTMLRGKSRLNVEWLGYSPGLLLEKELLAPARTPRNPRG